VGRRLVTLLDREPPTVDPALVEAVLEYSYECGWTDGLPTVPCTDELLASFLARTDRAPDDVLLEVGHLNRALTVRLAAINAVMAGCRADYFPTVLAAWDALRDEGYVGAGMWQSTTGLGALLVVNGPARTELGFNSGANLFGSGTRANATVGRTLRLVAINVFGLAPGVLDQSTQGTPAKYSLCIAENEEHSPWSGLPQEHGVSAGESSVTAMSMRSVSHLEARQARSAEQLLHDVAGTVARTGALLQETLSTCLVLSPEHAHLLADQGFDRPQVRAFLQEHAVVPADVLLRAGKDGISTQQRLRLPGDHPDAMADPRLEGGVLRVLAGPEAVSVVVAGAPNCGISAVVDAHNVGRPVPSIARIAS
jgi:hypothetical protein